MHTVLPLWRALDDRFERVEPSAWGAVVTDSRYPRIWDVNYARVETDDPTVTLEEIRTALDPALERAAADHRHLVVFHPGSLRHVIAAASTGGARLSWDAVLALEGEATPADPRGGAAPVDEVQPDDAFLGIVRDSLGHFDVTDPVAAEQLIAIERDVMIPAGKRWFRIEVEGRTAALGSLVVAARAGLVDHVVTLPFARRRGHAEAIVRRIAAEARADGADAVVLLTDPDGRARRIYERIGFRLVTTIASTVERR